MRMKLDQIPILAEFHDVEIIALLETNLRELSQLNMKDFHIFSVMGPTEEEVVWHILLEMCATSI